MFVAIGTLIRSVPVIAVPESNAPGTGVPGALSIADTTTNQLWESVVRLRRTHREAGHVLGVATNPSPECHGTHHRTRARTGTRLGPPAETDPADLRAGNPRYHLTDRRSSPGDLMKRRSVSWEGSGFVALPSMAAAGQVGFRTPLLGFGKDHLMAGLREAFAGITNW